MKRPPASDVLAAIRDAGGIMVKAAKALGCTRATLYSWVWMYGLADQVGLSTRAELRQDSLDCLDTSARIDAEARPDERNGGRGRKSVQSRAGKGPNLTLVSTPSTEHAPPASTRKRRASSSSGKARQQRSVTLSDDAWKRVLHYGVDTGETAGAIVERALVEFFKREVPDRG